MAEAAQTGPGMAGASPKLSRAQVDRLVRKGGQFLGQAIDCIISVKNAFNPQYNYLMQQGNEQDFSTNIKLWMQPWQRALQLERAERLSCQRCSPFGRLLIQSCSGSGSRMEQLANNGICSLKNCSDMDQMVVLGPVQWVCADQDAERAAKTTEPAGTTDRREVPRLATAPTGHLGFVRVLQQRQSNCPHPEALPFSAEDVRQFFSELMPDSELSINGPAISYAVLCPTPRYNAYNAGVPEIDSVPCLHIPCWPSEEFFKRCRETGWPPAAALEEMKRFGVHLVPVGARGSATEHLEWRWSFSRAEMVTVLHFDSVPRCAVKTVKACKTETSLQGKCLKSYYIKTAVFWLYQAQGGQPWESVSHGVVHILNYLEQALATKRLGCFFWKDINILELTTRDERRAALRTIHHIRKHMTSLLIQANWVYLPLLLREPQPRLSEEQMRVILVRQLIIQGVFTSSMEYYYVLTSHDDLMTLAILSSNPAEVCSMFREFTTAWNLKRILLHALIVAPREVASQIPLKASEDGGFFWDVAPLMSLLTEDDLREVLGDPDAVRVWLRRQHQLPETERPVGLPADLRSPRDLCDLLLNIPLFLSVLLQSVPSCHQRLELWDVQRNMGLHKKFRLTFEDTQMNVLTVTNSWVRKDMLFHTRLGLDRGLAQRRIDLYRVLFWQFCHDPATRAEHGRLRNVMPNSWQLKPLVFGAPNLSSSRGQTRPQLR